MANKTKNLINSIRDPEQPELYDILDQLNNENDTLKASLLVAQGILRNPNQNNAVVKAIQYNAADFVGTGALTWAVTIAQLTSFTYMIDSDKIMQLSWRIEGSTLGGVAAPEIRINIPDNRAIAGSPARLESWSGSGWGQDAGGTFNPVILANANVPNAIRVLKQGFGNFALGALTLEGSIRFSIGNTLFKNS